MFSFPILIFFVLSWKCVVFTFFSDIMKIGNIMEKVFLKIQLFYHNMIHQKFPDVFPRIGWIRTGFSWEAINCLMGNSTDFRPLEMKEFSLFGLWFSSWLFQRGCFICHVFFLSSFFLNFNKHPEAFPPTLPLQTTPH